MRRNKTGPKLLLPACLLSALMPLFAADNAVPAAPPASEIEQLKQMLADQQRQINELSRALSQQLHKQDIGGKVSAWDNTPAIPNLSRVSATTAPTHRSTALAAAFAIPAAPQPQASPLATSSPKNPCEADPERTIPTFLRLGNTCIVPIGFMDLTPVWRDKNAGSGMGSNFGSLPYNNTANGNLSEFRFSSQNSRIGFRVDGDWKGTHVIGYNEFDFNGSSGSNSLAVTNGSIVPRLRLFWLDARKGKLEFLTGQSWSLLTPNRTGVSALPGDLFYTQVTDINYMAGLTWTRQPGIRVLLHASKQLTFGFSAEQPDQYIGGSAGGSGITLPGGLTALAGAQLDNAAGGYLTQPTVTPDFIAKIAFDPTSRFHFEVGGIERNFKTTNLAPPFTTHHTTQGAGLLLGVNVAVLKNLRLLSTNFFSDGGGRYLFGQAPDVIVRADGSLSPVRADGTIDGVELAIKNTQLYAYYGGIYIGRNSALDANGKTPIGYGYTGSPNSQNRSINELTFGFNQTMWRNPRYGAINVMGQYEYLSRNPWFVATGAPKATHDSTIYFNIRYTLPGAMPNF